LTIFILVSLLLNIETPVYNLPAVSASCDIIVVMMQDGLLPEEPWEGMSTLQREKFWSLACSGMMLQRAGWSGYIILCPSGIGTEFLETAVALASAECQPDNSALSSGLQLLPASDCSSIVILFSSGGSDPQPVELPLRTSRWLEQDGDTLIVNSPEQENSFFWTDHPDPGSLASAAWRGTGSEAVPTGSTSVELAFTCAHGNVPSNLSCISIEPHELDAYYADTWGSAVNAVEGIITDIYPPTEDSNHLLWIRGSGTQKPWRTSPSPVPPPSVLYQIEMPEEAAPENPLNQFDASSIPGAVEIELPGRLAYPQRGPVMESILERIISRDVLSGSEDEIHFEVQCGTMGNVSIWLVNSNGTEIQEARKSEILERLRNTVLVPPGGFLIGNAVLRASYIEGEEIAPLGVREVSMELMNILYPDQ
jgi:hypothetical protein